jgi:acyl-CoA thioester hydrolase
MSTNTHTIPITITPDDIDFMGHVNNARYLGWVQDVVLAHWHRFAPADTAAAHLWVALKHEITYRRPAFLADDVVARTMLEKVAGARAFYNTVIERGGEVLAEVQSMWCCIDSETHRPARICRDLAETHFGIPKKAAATAD